MSAERSKRIIEKPATARVFFALWPSPEVADRLSDIACETARSFGGRATRRETIHLTLAFLGNVSEARLPELSATTRTVCAAPFVICLDHLGYWSHNHLLWAGCLVPPAPLGALFGELRRVVVAAGFRVGGEDRDFAPHVTLVRRVPEIAAPSASCPLPSITPIHWRCESFVLLRSTLSDDGPAYRIIDEFPLHAMKSP